jgi:hypothetical protein
MKFTRGERRLPYSEDGRRVWEADTPCIDPFVATPAMLVTPWLFGGAPDERIESKRHCLERFGAELIGALR